jgi:hypothetical protein
MWILCCWFSTLLTITVLCLVGVVMKDSRRKMPSLSGSSSIVERPPLQAAFVRGKRRSSDIESLIEMLEVECETMSSNDFADAINIVTQAVFERLDPQRDASVVTRLKRKVPNVSSCVKRLNVNIEYDRLVHTVAELYYESVRYRSSMYFLHISKSGGTAMCDLACRNGCRTPHCGKNGNCWSRQAKDGPIWEISNDHEWWMDSGVKLSRNAIYSNCLLEERHLISKDWNFVANENYLFGGETTPNHVQVCSNQFLNVVVIRDPVERVISHMAHMQALYNKRQKKNIIFDNVKKFVSDFQVVSSNYMSRILLGGKIFRELDNTVLRSNHTLANEYLRLAKRHLSEFDVVIIMSDLFSNRAGNVLRRGLGWSDVDLKSIVGENRFSGTNRTRTISSNDLKIIRDANELDMKLYEYAKFLAFSDRAFFDMLPSEEEEKEEEDGGKKISSTKSSSIHNNKKKILKWMRMDVPCEKKCGHVCSVHFEFEK